MTQVEREQALKALHAGLQELANARDPERIGAPCDEEHPEFDRGYAWGRELATEVGDGDLPPDVAVGVVSEWRPRPSWECLQGLVEAVREAQRPASLTAAQVADRFNQCAALLGEVLASPGCEALNAVERGQLVTYHNTLSVYAARVAERGVVVPA